MKNVYVVSADIYSLLKKWAIKNEFVLPDQDFFKKLRSNFIYFFSEIFPDFKFIEENEIILKMSELLKDEKLTIISIDPVYYQSKHRLDLCRVIDLNGVDCGYGKRANCDTLIKQLANLKQENIKDAVLVDDVIFTGSSIIKIVDLLKKININVSTIYTAIALNSAIEKLESKVKVVSIFSFDRVIDEICERDFYPGVPLSGRQITGNKNIRAPYILPFGNPEKWASIPKNKAKELSNFCIKQSIILFSEIQRKSKKNILCKHIGYQLVGLNRGNNNFIEALFHLL